MNTTKTVSATIRTQLKKDLGLTSKDVSVKTDSYTSVRITVLSVVAYSVKASIEAIAKAYESISYCQSSGEILSGGNLFVFVNVDTQVKKAIAAPYMDDAKRLSMTVAMLRKNQGESLDGKDFALINDEGRFCGFSGGSFCGYFYSGEIFPIALAIANAPTKGANRVTDSAPAL